jgi:hypothetical protein
VTIIPVKLFDEFKRVFRVLELSAVKTMKVELRDKRTVKMQVVIEPFCEIFSVKLTFNKALLVSQYRLFLFFTHEFCGFEWHNLSTFLMSSPP